MPAQVSSLPFCSVAVMPKATSAGLKTRLCPPLSQDEAASLDMAFMQDAVQTAALAGVETSLAGAIACVPPGSPASQRERLPRAVKLHEVRYPDFGDCLHEAMRLQFSAGYRAACVLHPDHPTVPAALLIEMVDILFRPGDRAVLGPSTDGGYYLLACKTLHPRLFRGIAWGADAVAAQTLMKAAEIGLPVHVLPKWYGVKDGASLRQLASELLDGVRYSRCWDSAKAPHATALLKSMAAGARLLERLGLVKTGHEKTLQRPERSSRLSSMKGAQEAISA